jgi:hypothetical protein
MAGARFVGLLEWPFGLSRRGLRRTAIDRLQVLDEEIERLRVLIGGIDHTWDEIEVFNLLAYFKLCKLQRREMQRLTGAGEDAANHR